MPPPPPWSRRLPATVVLLLAVVAAAVAPSAFVSRAQATDESGDFVRVTTRDVAEGSVLQQLADAEEHLARTKWIPHDLGAPSVFSTTGWNTSFSLAEPASMVSIVSSNASFFVAGGCLNVTCTERSSRTHQYDLASGEKIEMPELLSGGVAGRTVAVPLDSMLYIVRACSIISQEEVNAGLSDETLDNFTKVEVVDPATDTVAILGLNNVSRDDAVANATCLQFNSPSTNPAIFIIGGYHLRSGTVTNRISMIILDPSAPYFVRDAGTLPRATMNLAGFATTSAMFVAGGFVDAAGTPSRRHYTILTSAVITNLPLCIFESAQLPSSVPELKERWNDLQMVGFASRQLIMTSVSILSMWDLGLSEFYPNQLMPTYFPPGSTTTWEQRHGSTLVMIPYWTPNTTDNRAVHTVLFRVGGIAIVNETVPITTTPAPTTSTATVGPSTSAEPMTSTLPPSTTTATAAPATTTTAAPTTATTTTTTTTPAPPPPTSTTTAAPSTTTAVPNATLLIRPFARETAPAMTSHLASSDDSGTAAAAEYVQVLRPIRNITFAYTSITLPSPDVTSTRLNQSDSTALDFTLTSSTIYNDGTDSLCFDDPGRSLCQLETAKDASCYNKVKAVGPVNTRHVDLPLINIGAGNPFWVCFTFGNRMSVPNHVRCPADFAADAARLQYSVLNFFHPFVIEALPPPTDAPTPPPPKKGPFLENNKLTVALAIVAVVLLVGLIGTFVFFRNRSRMIGGAGHSERYTEMEEIGRGAFGRVLRVKRNSDGAVFAKKHIDCPHAEVLAEALKEFELLRTLQAHPNIIRVVDMFLNYEVVGAPVHDAATSNNKDNAGSPLLGRQGSRLNDHHQGQQDALVPAAPTRHLCIVMDYHPKKDLKLWALDYPGRIPEPVLCHVAVQSCSVLSFIHQKNVIHRDLKPENILIVSQATDDYGVAVDVAVPGSARSRADSRGDNAPGSGGGGGQRRGGSADTAGWPRLMQQVVVTDFGLAHLVAEGRSIGFVGTAVYSAPECVALLMRGNAAAQAALSPQRPSDTPNGALGNVNATPRGVLDTNNKSRGGGYTKSGRHARTGSASLDGVTAQCDIWSLGCVLYAVATKRLERQTVRKMFEDVYRPEFRSNITSELLSSGYSRPFANFILRLLSAMPEDRPTAKDALKYFRKSNRDGSYSVSETQKYTPQEKAEMQRKQREKEAAELRAAAAAAGGGSTRHLGGPSRPTSKTSAPQSSRAVNSGPLRSPRPGQSNTSGAGTPRALPHTPRNGGGDGNGGADTSATRGQHESRGPGGPGTEHSSELGTVNATPRTAQPTPRE